MDYGMEIINKETNQRCDYVSFDHILDTDLLENSFDEIHTFILDKMSTSEDWQQYLICRPYPDDQKFEDVWGERLVISINDSRFDEFNIVKKLVTELLGSMFGIQEIQIFFDGDMNDEPAAQSFDCHVDEDNFIWVKLNTNRTLTVLERDEKMTFDYKLVVGDKFSYFSPAGFFHGPPSGGTGIAMRISLKNEWFTSNNKSKICNDIVKYIKEFSYKVRLYTGSTVIRNKLSFVDYSEHDSRNHAQARFTEKKGFMFDFNEEGRMLYLKDNTEEFYT